MGEYAAFSPNLTLLDIGLPFHNGLYWCKEIRRISNAPIVFLSSASDNMNIVLAMNMGGDDFISKPFDLSVLTAKIDAVMRRCYGSNAASDILEHKGVRLNVSEAALVHEGEKIELTKNEFIIIMTLMESKGKIVSQCRLQNTLDMQKSYLRRNSTDFTVQKPERTQKALFCRIDSSLAVRIVIAYLTFLHGELLL